MAQELKRRGYEVELATDERVEKYQSEFPARAIHLVPSATFASRSPIAVAKTCARLFGGYLKARNLCRFRLPSGFTPAPRRERK